MNSVSLEDIIPVSDPALGSSLRSSVLRDTQWDLHYSEQMLGNRAD